MARSLKSSMCLVALAMSLVACENAKVQFLLVQDSEHLQNEKIWNALVEQVETLKMDCIPDLADDDPLLVLAGRGAAPRELFCFWAKGQQKMQILAASSEEEMMILIYSQTTDIFLSTSEAERLLTNINAQVAGSIENMKTTICLVDCEGQIRKRSEDISTAQIEASEGKDARKN